MGQTKRRRGQTQTQQPIQPLAEVFGHLIDDQSPRAMRYRSRRLCPFNNKVPNCTKDKAKNPLGVCSVLHDNAPAITCPVRFREDWLITDDAASFFFGDDAAWSSLTEVRLNDADGKSAGNIDVVLVAYDSDDKIYDFGALEVQAVYISGNVRNPFAYYMEDPTSRASVDWSTQPNYPRPDFLSSSRKRLAPQLLLKSGILHNWGKKTAIAIDRRLSDTLPIPDEVSKTEADIAWMLYDVVSSGNPEIGSHLSLVLHDVVYSKWWDLSEAERIPAGEDIDDFWKRINEMMEAVVVQE